MVREIIPSARLIHAYMIYGFGGLQTNAKVAVTFKILTFKRIAKPSNINMNRTWSVATL